LSSTALIDTLIRGRYNEISMKKGQNKFIIGLTGRIGTGKSLVRSMLEHLGVFGIDADALSRAVLEDTTLQEKVIDTFGPAIAGPGGGIDRAELARLVFSDPKSLAKLEAILHPPIIKMTEELVRGSRLPFIVIEAIKLLESDLAAICDTVWVTRTDEQVVLDRLSKFRGICLAEAKQRLENQTALSGEIAAADTVVHNNSPVLDTWRQVKNALADLKDQEHKTLPALQNADTAWKQASKKLVTPDSEIIKSVLARLPDLQMHLPVKNNPDPDADPFRTICTQFVFAGPNSGTNTCLTAWERSLRAFTLRQSVLSACSQNDALRIILSDVEKFADLFQAGALEVPINKEAADFWGGLLPIGFALDAVPAGKKPGGNAGYNVYRKALN